MRITLNAGGLGGMPISSFQSDAASLTSKIDILIVAFVAVKNQTCNLNGGVGALQSALDSVQARVNNEIARKEAAIAAQVQVNSFLALTIQIDNQVAVILQQNTEEFYNVNPWLQPASEKSWWERLGDGWNHFWGGVGDFLKSARDALMNWVKGIGEFFSKTVWEKWIVKGFWETFCKEWVWEKLCKKWIWETFCKDWIADKAWNWIKRAAKVVFKIALDILKKYLSIKGCRFLGYLMALARDQALFWGFGLRITSQTQ